MSTPNPVLSTTIFIFALQAIVLCVMIIRKQPRTSANIFLAMIVFFYALNAFNIALINVLISYDLFPLFRYIQLELLFGIGPAMYFYTKSITDQNFSFRKKDFLHFIPLVLEFIFYRTPFYRLGADGMYQVPVHQYTKIYLTEQWLGVWSITIYTLFSLSILYKHRIWLKQHYSSIEKRSLKWLRIPIMIYSIHWLGWRLLSEIDRVFFEKAFRDIYFLPSFVGLSIVTCWIGFKGYLHNSIDNPLKAEKKPNPSSNQNIAELAHEVTTLMVSKKPYLDPDLDLSKLAELLKMNTKVVSQIINQSFAKNFYEYVNEYRVEAFKHRIKEKDHRKLTLLGHAFECGFNSKSTFNHTFKKMVGKTPSKYAKEVRNESE